MGICTKNEWDREPKIINSAMTRKRSDTQETWSKHRGSTENAIPARSEQRSLSSRNKNGKLVNKLTGLPISIPTDPKQSLPKRAARWEPLRSKLATRSLEWFWIVATEEKRPEHLGNLFCCCTNVYILYIYYILYI